MEFRREVFQHWKNGGKNKSIKINDERKVAHWKPSVQNFCPHGTTVTPQAVERTVDGMGYSCKQIRPEVVNINVKALKLNENR